MVWPFSKTKHINALENRLNMIESSLRVSFYNIKKDITDIKSTNNSQNKETLRRIELLESQIFNLKEKTKSEQDETSHEESEITEPFLLENLNKPSIVESITEVQQNILMLLAKLHIENPDRWTSAKQIAEELYPEKKYDTIRPMISTYLDVLEELNLIRKLRKRRQVFTKLTEKGISYIDPKLKIKIKPSIKHKKIT